MSRRMFGFSIGKSAIFIVVLTAFLASFAIGHAADLEQKKLTIGVPGGSVSFFPNTVAKVNGYYKDEGFENVEILAFKGNGPTVQALAAGTIDICIASLHGLVNTINSGQKFKAFWAGYNMAIFSWWAQPKYKSVSDAKGGSFGVSRYGSLTDSLTRYVLQQNGLDPEKDVKILQSGNDSTILAALESGQLDVGILSSVQALMAGERDLNKVADQKDDAAQDYPTHVVYAKEGYIAKNPNAVKAYIRATGKAMEWIKANPADAAKMLAEQNKVDPKYCQPALDAISYGWYPDGRLPGPGMKVFWEITVAIGDAKEPWPTSKWLDDSFLKTQGEWRK